MTLEEKQDLASAHNWLIDFMKNNPGPFPYGGDAQLKNILYVLKTHTSNVPLSPKPNLSGHKDYEFIYTGKYYNYDIEQFRSTRRGMPTQRFVEKFGLSGDTSNAPYVEVYMDGYYIEKYDDSKFVVNFMNVSYMTETLENAELILWHGFVKGELGINDNYQININEYTI